MATLTDRDIRDLVTGTLDNYDPPSFKMIATDLQKYEVMEKWLRRDRVSIDGGVGVKRNLMARTANTARHVGLAEDDLVTIADLLEQVDVPWRHVDASWAFGRHEVLANRGKELITNVVKPRRIGAMIDIADELEEKAWASPAADNKTDPYGITWWLQKSATQGFNGGLPAGFSTMAGIDLDTTPNFKNYTDTYTAMTDLDVGEKMRRAHMYCTWKSPVKSSAMKEMDPDKRIYCNPETRLAFDRIARSQNDNLGLDIAVMYGQSVFKRAPIIEIWPLESETDDPIYMVDHACFMVFVRRGDYLRESEVDKIPNKHNWFQVFVDLSYNYLMYSRRSSAVLYKV